MIDSAGSRSNSTIHALQSRLQLGERVGAGGYSTVYRAADQQDPDRVYAVKVLNGRLLTPTDRRRFDRECAALSRLAETDGVLRLRGAWVDDKGWAHLATDLCASNYADRVRSLGPLSAPEVVEVGIDVATVLAEAHGLGIHHGDIKPNNLFLDNDQRLLLGDFGAATLADVTVDSLPPFSLRYSAPEVLEAGETGPAADLYSLGATLHHLATGAPPLRSGTDDLDDVPVALAKVIRQLLAPRPNRRPESAKKVVELLATLQVDGLEQRRSPFRPRALALASLLLATIGVGSLLFWQSGRQTEIGNAAAIAIQDAQPPQVLEVSVAPTTLVLTGLASTTGKTCTVLCESFADGLQQWFSVTESQQLTLDRTADGYVGDGLEITGPAGSVTGKRYIERPIGAMPDEGISVRMWVKVTDPGGIGYWLNLFEIADGSGGVWGATLGSGEADQHLFVARRSNLLTGHSATVGTGSFSHGSWQCIAANITPAAPVSMTMDIDGRTSATIPGPHEESTGNQHSLYLGSTFFDGELPTIIIDEVEVGDAGTLNC